jgi:hypothetical protein
MRALFIAAAAAFCATGALQERLHIAIEAGASRRSARMRAAPPTPD